MRRFFPLLASLALVLVVVPRARARDDFDRPETMAAWTAKMAQDREVVDRLVVCFDEPSFLREIGKWDAKRFWPVLLWDSDLVPKFIEAFGPKQVLLARVDEKGPADLDAARAAVAAAWGIDAEAAPKDAKAFLEVLTARERAPVGVVLLAEGSPELLGGAALAAGRFHLPLVFATEEKHGTRIDEARLAALRKELAGRIDALGVDWQAKFDDLDFVTVADDLPFAYTLEAAHAHPGRYTVDDALARHDDDVRWGWVGRLVGGEARSVYMAMGALFLQPKRGLLWSRYNPKNATFGAFSPAEALETFRTLFPTEMVEHPDATLAKWRALEWPRGNRFGFVYVNSSGGARTWSTSKGQATHFDVPDTIPTVVHYTHSGSAGAPFDTDSIAGRWMANGAYVYFGSHAEPYLQSFVPPVVLARRVAAGVPLGAAMRQLYGPGLVGTRKMKVKGEEKLVRFNMSGPWKLAYFGDPSYRLTGKEPERVAPEKPDHAYYPSVRAFQKSHAKTKAWKEALPIAALGATRLDPHAKKLVDLRVWKKLLKSGPEGDRADALLREMVRLQVEAWRRAGAKKLHDPKALRKLAHLPEPIRDLVAQGADDPAAARGLVEFAKGYVAGLDGFAESGVGKDRREARWVLVLAARLVQPKGAAKPFYTWVVEAARALGVAPDDLAKEITEPSWVPEAVKKAVRGAVKGKLAAPAEAKKGKKAA